MLVDMMFIPPHVAHRRQVDAPPLRGPMVGLAGQRDRFAKGESRGPNLFDVNGRRALRATFDRMAEGGLVGCASTGCISFLASWLGAVPAVLTPQTAVLIGLGAAGTALILAGGDRSRITGAAPAFVAFEAIALQPVCAAIAGGITVGLLWAAHQPNLERPGLGAAGSAAPGVGGRVPLPAARRPPG